MRFSTVVTTLCACAVWTLTWADIDLTDFDDDVMRTMGESIKTLETDIAAHNTQGALATVRISRQGLQYAEDYFSAKGDAPDAVKFARDSRALTDSVLQALRSRDTRKALAATQDLSRSCKRCHDVYRPPEP